MPPKNKRIRLQNVKSEQNFSKPAYCIDPAVKKNLQLQYVCGFCDQIQDDDVEAQMKHVQSHAEEITFCWNCCIFVKHEETAEHLKEYHYYHANQIKLELAKVLIEVRIPLEKCYSNFWGIVVEPNERSHTFTRLIRQRFDRHRTARYLGSFRVNTDLQLAWNCPICTENPMCVFKETIGMRLSALNHYEQCHRELVEEAVPGFLSFEWHQLAEETDFDVISLMKLANQRVQIKNRGLRTFYTVNLSRLTGGAHFHQEIEKRMGSCHGDAARFCLICCNLVEESCLKQHFTWKSHVDFNAVAYSTAFTCADKENLERESEENEDHQRRLARFPEDMFEYITEYKNIRVDVYKWKCSLCPDAQLNTFTTIVIMRMHALRHIDQDHRCLFTDEFLEFEWNSLKQEMRAAFDLRGFTPEEYTIRGEGTFAEINPNDYMLPQQFFFLPKLSIESTIICGFCYQCVDRKQFLDHIQIHGFKSSGTQFLGKVPNDQQARELMGRHRFDDPPLDDEPHNVLTFEGEQLRIATDQLSDRCSSSLPPFSECSMTPVKSDRDEEGRLTPRRKSAVTARTVLTATFKEPPKVVPTLSATGNESPCHSASSSSDESNSEDDRFERTMEETMIGGRKSRSRESTVAKNQFSKMKPAEIRNIIKNAAMKKGIEWRSSSSDSDSSDSEVEDVAEGKKTWESMKLKDIKELIKQAAKRKQIETRDSSSSSDSDSD